MYMDMCIKGHLFRSSFNDLYVFFKLFLSEGSTLIYYFHVDNRKKVLKDGDFLELLQSQPLSLKQSFWVLRSSSLSQFILLHCVSVSEWGLSQCRTPGSTIHAIVSVAVYPLHIPGSFVLSLHSPKALMILCLFLLLNYLIYKMDKMEALPFLL